MMGHFSYVSSFHVCLWTVSKGNYPWSWCPSFQGPSSTVYCKFVIWDLSKLLPLLRLVTSLCLWTVSHKSFMMSVVYTPLRLSPTRCYERHVYHCWTLEAKLMPCQVQKFSSEDTMLMKTGASFTCSDSFRNIRASHRRQNCTWKRQHRCSTHIQSHWIRDKSVENKRHKALTPKMFLFIIKIFGSQDANFSAWGHPSRRTRKTGLSHRQHRKRALEIKNF
jgi:hypothetical protein